MDDDIAAAIQVVRRKGNEHRSTNRAIHDSAHVAVDDALDRVDDASTRSTCVDARADGGSDGCLPYYARPKARIYFFVFLRPRRDAFFFTEASG